MRIVFYLSVSVLCFGCPSDPTPPSGGSEDVSVGTLVFDGAMDTEMGVSDGAPLDGSDANPSDGSPIDGALTDGGVSDGTIATDGDMDGAIEMRPDQMLPLEIDDCATACERVMACERFDLHGDQDTCEAACERASRREAPATWFQCVEVEACALLHLCRLPDPPPLTCDEVCEALTQCDEAPPFDCAAACEAGNGDGAFARCGEQIHGGGCETAQFWECLADQVYPDCVYKCDVGVQCNVLRPENCVRECIDQLASDDPLRALRGRQQNQCVRAAQEDCRQVDLCINIAEEPEPVVVTREAFCADWNRCFMGFVPCEFVWDEFPNGRDVAGCAMNIIRQDGCPANPNLLLQQCLRGNPGPVGPGCNELCEAQFTCGFLEDEQNQFECARACNEAIASGDEEVAFRQSELFVCGLADSCEDLTVCLGQNSPQAACGALCARLDGCGLADDACGADCDALFFRSRHTAYRACVEAAEDCPAMEACHRPAELDCQRICQRSIECGVQAEDCQERCDDALFDNFEETMEMAACFFTSPSCTGPTPSIERCGLDSEPGQPCARHCLALSACAPAPADELTDCLEACGDGYTGGEAVRFAAGIPCLDGLAADEECGAREACLPDPVDPDCVGWCGTLEGCEVAPAACAETCPEDVLSQIRSFEHLACIGDALACEAVEACLGDASPLQGGEQDADALCQLWNQCGYEAFGQCEGFVEDRVDADHYGCVLNEMRNCPETPFDALEICADGGGGASTPAAVRACLALCHAQAQCSEPEEGATIRGCAAECINTLDEGNLDDIRRVYGALNCRAAASCSELDGCLRANRPEEACGAYCGALDGCGLAGEDCAERCDAGFYRSRNEAARACVADAGPNCEAVTACLPSVSLPCQYLCDRRDACRMNVRDCVAECDDAHYASPETAGRRFACETRAPLCWGEAPDALAECESPDAAGGTCWAYCWARTGCDATDGVALGNCLIECGEGFVGAEGLRFAASEACLDEAVNQGEERCAGFVECIPEEVVVDCAPWCAALGPCDGPENCVEACPDDALSALRVLEQTDCLVGEDGGCQAVAECVETDRPVDPGPPDPNAFCEAYQACGFEAFFPCDQIVPIIDAELGGLECLMANIDPCPVDPIVLLNACAGGGQGAIPRRNYGPVCERFCRAQARCELTSNNARDCQAGCIGILQVDENGLVNDLIDCRDALTCVEMSACAQEAFGDACEGPCNQYIDCGGEAFADLAACRAECNGNRVHPNVLPNYVDRVETCLTELAEENDENQAACAAEGHECFVPGRRGEVLGCEELCPPLVACGIFAFDLQECIGGCLEADNDERENNEAVRACLSLTLVGGRCDNAAIQECFEDGEELVDGPAQPDRPLPPPNPRQPPLPPER